MTSPPEESDMTKPAIVKLNFWRGNTEPFEFRLEDKTGAPFDLTGYDVRMRVSHDNGIIRKSLAAGTMTCADPTTGVVSAEFSPAETRPMIMSRKPGDWELEISTDNGAFQRTLMTGPVTAEGGDNDD